MPVPPSETSLFRRNLLGAWFCGLSVLGYLRFFMKTLREPALPPDTVAWLWLAGSVVLSLLGIAIIVREARRGSNRT